MTTATLPRGRCHLARRPHRRLGRRCAASMRGEVTDFIFHDLAGAARAGRSRRRQALREGARPLPRLGRGSATATPLRPRPRASVLRAPIARSTWSRGLGRARPAGRPERARRRSPPRVALNPQLHLRPVRDRRRQPARPRRRAGRRRAAGQAYNPLFLHGPPGLGKTHLLHAIGNYIARYGARDDRALRDRRGLHQRVRLRVRARQRPTSRSRFRDADVLLIDDIQFLAEQAEDRGGVLPHLQRALRGRPPARAHRDRAPASSTSLEARLRERFDCGLVAESSRPA